MKTTLKLFLTLFAFVPLLSMAQGASFTSFYADSSQYQVCDTTYYFNISSQTMDWNSYAYGNLVFNGSNYINASLTATVDWGDNTTSTHTGTVVSNGTAIAWSNTWTSNNSISHGYNPGGTYVVTVTLSDPVSGNSISTVQTIIVGACNQSVIAFGNLDCDNDGIYEGSVNSIPYTLQGNGTVYTAISSPNGFNLGNVNPGYYQVVIDQSWLTANGYILQNVSPDSILFDATTWTSTISFDLSCDSTLFIAQCLDGTVFCDSDNDGILDSLETILANAPVNLYLPNGNVLTDSSDANGNYSFSYTGMTGVSFVQVDPQWITSNGYYFASNVWDTLSNLDCTNGVIENIPVICDSTALAASCIDGYLFCDANNNGVLDSTEMILSGAPIIINGVNTTVSLTTDSTGYFTYSGWQLSTGGGAVTISVDQAWLTANGYTSNMLTTIASLNCLQTNTVYVGVDCTNNSGCADLWTSVTPWIGYYQNTINSIRLNWGNNGQLASGNYTLTLDYPSGVTPVTSSINNSNYTISGNTITWTINSSSTWFSSTDVIYFDTPAGIADSTFHVFGSTITSTTNDCDSTNNYGVLGMYVGVSYDPNDKSVNQPFYVDPGVQDEYTYVVRFQNTGTAPAQDVYILDTLSTKLDWSTLQVVETTHQMQMIDYGNGVIKFDFPQIWLPDSTTNEPASHGHVVYKIKEISNINIGDVIENTAYIYFDQNAPIVTNTTVNVNMILGLDDRLPISIALYPNPSNDILNIRTESQIQQIRIVDLSGRIVLQSNPLSMQEVFDVSGLSNGLYAVQITTANGQANKTFVKF